LKGKQLKVIAMKHLPLFLLLQLFWFFPLLQNTTAQAQHNLTAKQTSAQQYLSGDYVFDLPFTEDWEYHSFTHNLWTISDDAWVIDTYNGNDGASAKFSGGSMQTNYSSTLTSNWLAGSNMFVGTVTLKFDMKLIDIAQTGTEFLYIKLFNGTDYFTLDSINNIGSFDWESYEYDISDISFGNDFKIVFDAQGTSSTNISGWFVDNIEVYRECEPPRNLEGEASVANNGGWYCIIGWEAPEMFIPASPWKQWDSGENFTAFGPLSASFKVAARWDANMLTDVDGDTIKKIRYFISNNQFDFLIVHVWTGPDAINTIYSDTIPTIVAGEWNDHILTDTLILDASLEYWVGYEIIGNVAGTYPAGTDAGPANIGFGDKISTDGVTWDNLSDFGLSYNWNIEMYVIVPPDTSNHGLNHFVVYKSADGNNYSILDSICFIPSQMYYEIEDYDIGNHDVYFYKVNAVWGENGDTCISNYARNKHLPIEDFVEIFNPLIGIHESVKNSGLLIYPNPVSNFLTIHSEFTLLNLAIYDLTGRKVYSGKVPGPNNLTLDVSELKNGLYLLKAETNQGTFISKIIKRGD